MNKPVRVLLLDDVRAAYEKLNTIVGEQLAQGKTNIRLTIKSSATKRDEQRNPLVSLNRFTLDHMPAELRLDRL